MFHVETALLNSPPLIPDTQVVIRSASIPWTALKDVGLTNRTLLMSVYDYSVQWGLTPRTSLLVGIGWVKKVIHLPQTHKVFWGWPTYLSLFSKDLRFQYRGVLGLHLIKHQRHLGWLLIWFLRSLLCFVLSLLCQILLLTKIVPTHTFASRATSASTFSHFTLQNLPWDIVSIYLYNLAINFVAARLSSALLTCLQYTSL